MTQIFIFNQKPGYLRKKWTVLGNEISKLIKHELSEKYKSIKILFFGIMIGINIGISNF